jgi:hypothetical protein
MVYLRSLTSRRLLQHKLKALKRGMQPQLPICQLQRNTLPQAQLPPELQVVLEVQPMLDLTRTLAPKVYLMSSAKSGRTRWRE